MEKENYYEKLFINNEVKATAFDKIAKKYFYGNFGTMSKSDFETLLFSEYFDVVKENYKNSFDYSDYELSKQLGISQSKVTNLKIRKELQYPNEKSNWWKDELLKLSKNAKYDKGKVRLCILDKTVFLEAKNAVEKNGSFIEMTLTNNLLQLDTVDYILLMTECSDNKDEIFKLFKKELKIQNNTNETWSSVLKKQINNEFVKTLVEKSINLLPAVCGGVLSIAMNAINKKIGEEK